MDHTNLQSPSNATASPVRDALRGRLVPGVISELARTINSRESLHVGCWNVRTLLDEGSQSIAIRSLHDYKVDIACLSEVRISGSGSKVIKVPGRDQDYSLYYSGPPTRTGQHGVAIAMNKRARDALLAWEPISERIAVARFKGTITNMTVVAVYAPTLNSDDTVKYDFYAQLQAVMDRTPQRDLMLIAGDWNARTGPADESTRHILGKYALGQRCENGGRLVNFAALNRLVVTNTRFQHPRRQLLTWYSNDGHTANQIDYILIRSRWSTSVLDSRAYRGAEAGSDHALVRAKIKLRLSTRRKLVPPKRINLMSLSDPQTRSVFDTTIRERFSSSAQCERVPSTHVDVSLCEYQWQELKCGIKETMDSVLKEPFIKKKDWISDATLSLSSRARAARLANSANYKDLRRQATRSARRDRQAYWAEVAGLMESATNCGDYHQLYRLLRKASGKQVLPNTTLRDSAGSLIPDTESKVMRWRQHFSDLLNPPLRTSADLHLPTAPPYDANCESPTMDEISHILKRLKNHKAPGEDGIPAEILKSCCPELLSAIHGLFETVWNLERCPADWSQSIILPIPKRGDRTQCANYRGISLIDVTAKVFAILLLGRFSAERHQRTRDNQGGFRPGRGCIDQIFTLRRVLEHRHKNQQETSACFIDFKTAFDSIDREALWRILLADGVPPKLVNLIRAYYDSTSARVRVLGEESSPFSLTAGVRQGCPLSPVLFNFLIDWVMNQAVDASSGCRLSPNLLITDLDYADDIVVLGETPSSLQTTIDRIAEYAACVNLAINVGKTKLITTYSGPPQLLFINGEVIEQVSHFRYLGSDILPNGQAKDEIEHRINQARVAFMQLNRALWTRSEIGMRTKLLVYRASIRPVLLYACETWPLRSTDVHALEVFDRWCLRRIANIRWPEQISDTALHRKCFDIPELGKYIQFRRLQWFGHVLRKPSTELTRLSVDPERCRNWSYRRGGQLKTWLSTVKSDVDALGLAAVYGLRQWNNNWVNVCEGLASDRRQ